MIITGRTPGEQTCWSEPWTGFSARTVFGQLKTCQELSMMSRRGHAACESEWLLACAAHNLRKLHRHRLEG